MSVVKYCAGCGCELVWEHIPRVRLASSANIEDYPICHDCMIEHCVSTNCYACELGTYSDCRFLELKQNYMSD